MSVREVAVIIPEVTFNIFPYGEDVFSVGRDEHNIRECCFEESSWISKTNDKCGQDKAYK